MSGSPIFVALDIDSEEQALDMATSLRKMVGGFKIGPRLALRGGESFLRKISEQGPLFLDCKFLDIPSTMEASVRTAFTCGASFVTIHAWAGRDALKQLSKLEKELSEQRPFRILAVTILTSFTQKSLSPPMDESPIDIQVSSLAKLVLDSGLRGLVCSPQEVQNLRKTHPESFLVTPGIRDPSQTVSADDQSRTLSAVEAMHRGANALVIGRPIVRAEDPLAVAQRLSLQLAAWTGQI